jgi:hypothetical protein
MRVKTLRDYVTGQAEPRKQNFWVGVTANFAFLLSVALIIMLFGNHIAEKAGSLFRLTYSEAIVVALLFRLTRKV